jgi:hypothetical protein
MAVIAHWNVAIWDDGTIAGIYPVNGPQPAPRSDMRVVEVVPASQLAGAVEALREVERARHLEGKDAGTKADIMARIARDALHQHGGQ